MYGYSLESSFKGLSPAPSLLRWSLVFGLWSLGLWSLVFGLWSLVFGLWSFVFRLSCLVFGLWSLGLGLSSFVFGLSSFVFGLWSLVFGLWPLVLGLWSFVFGLWSFVFRLLSFVFRLFRLWSLVLGLWALIFGLSTPLPFPSLLLSSLLLFTVAFLIGGQPKAPPTVHQPPGAPSTNIEIFCSCIRCEALAIFSCSLPLSSHPFSYFLPLLFASVLFASLLLFSVPFVIGGQPKAPHDRASTAWRPLYKYRNFV